MVTFPDLEAFSKLRERLGLDPQSFCSLARQQRIPDLAVQLCTSERTLN
jgi:hypothetical protein